MSGQALVSIVIPVYNGGNFLREAIDSALAQTWPNIEVLVVNDGSADGGETERIARSYGERIRYIAKENGGVATALNLGIREMRGEYFSWLSHDDLYYPEKVASNLDFLAGRPEGSIVYSDFEEVDSQGKLLRQCRLKNVPAEQLRVSFMLERAIHGCSLLVPAVCFERCGVFDERLIVSQDYDLWFRFASQFPFLHQPEVLVKSRVHPSQGSRTITGGYDEIEQFLERCLEQLSPEEISSISPRSTRALGYLHLAGRLIAARTPRVARAAFDRGRALLGEERAGGLLIGYLLEVVYLQGRLRYLLQSRAKSFKRWICGWAG